MWFACSWNQPVISPPKHLLWCQQSVLSLNVNMNEWVRSFFCPSLCTSKFIGNSGWCIVAVIILHNEPICIQDMVFFASTKNIWCTHSWKDNVNIHTPHYSIQKHSSCRRPVRHEVPLPGVMLGAVLLLILSKLVQRFDSGPIAITMEWILLYHPREMSIQWQERWLFQNKDCYYYVYIYSII